MAVCNFADEDEGSAVGLGFCGGLGKRVGMGGKNVAMKEFFWCYHREVLD